jgi:hypothetical protein
LLHEKKGRRVARKNIQGSVIRVHKAAGDHVTEYLAKPGGKPVGPDVDALPDDKRASIEACLDFFALNAERIRHFSERIEALGRSGADTIITLIDVDDPTGNGAVLAELLMPGHDWQQYRDKGVPAVARGLADKEPFPDILARLGYDVAARELASTDELRVLVLHAETVQIMDVQFLPQDNHNQHLEDTQR